MLGKRPEDVLEDRTVQRIFLICNVAHPETSETDPDSWTSGTSASRPSWGSRAGRCTSTRSSRSAG